jgi:hypothetical protein
MWTLAPDVERLSSTGEGPDELWHRSRPLAGSEAEAYLAKRRVPPGVAAAAAAAAISRTPPAARGRDAARHLEVMG